MRTVLHDKELKHTFPLTTKVVAFKMDISGILIHMLCFTKELNEPNVNLIIKVDENGSTWILIYLNMLFRNYVNLESNIRIRLGN